MVKVLTFFEEAFGRNLDEYYKILWMPETFIIYRRKYDQNLRERLAEKYTARSEEDYECTDPEILEILSYYRIMRDIAEGNN